MYKVDLHTHSVSSPDGGISLRQYKKAIESGRIDCVAITDHNHIDTALKAKAALGERVIVGEEIMTTKGEVIGLFLKKRIAPGQSLEKTVAAIKAQDGIVYIPHPFETIRKGLSEHELKLIEKDVDIIEGLNGRAFAQNRSQRTITWAKLHSIPTFASSDAHGAKGLGRTYTSLRHIPSRDNLLELLQSATLHTRRPNARILLYPKYHKIRKKVLFQA